MNFRITIKIEVFNTKLIGKQVYKSKISKFLRGTLIILSILCSPMLQQLTWTNLMDSNSIQSNTESTSFSKEDLVI